MRFPPKHPWLLAGALAVLAVIVTFDPKLYINGDNVDYMNLARAVRQGDLWSSSKYPPLFPMLLAPVQAVFGMRLLPQKILVTVFAAGAIWLLAGIVRRRTGVRAGPWLFFAAATLIPFVEYAHYTMSEVPFLFFQLGALAVCDRISAGGAARPPFRRMLALALWIAAAFYTRTAGASLAAGVLGWLLLSRRPRQALVLAALLAVAAIPWGLHAAGTTGGNPYFQQLLRVNPYYPELGTLTLGGWVQRLGENAEFYLLGMVPDIVMPLLYGSTYSPPRLQKLFLPLWLSIPLLIPLAAGFWRGLFGAGVARDSGPGSAGGLSASSGRPREADPVAVVVLAALLLLCLWPAIWAGSRFLVPIAPLLLLVWWTGWHLPEDKGVRGPWGRLRAGFLVLLLALSVRNLVFYVDQTRRYPPEWENYFSSLEWIRDHAPQSAVIIDRKPGFAEFTTRRRSLTFPREKDAAVMVDGFRRSGVTHVVLASLPYDDITRFLQPAIEKEYPRFRLVHKTTDPATFVFEFHPEGRGVSAPPPAR